MEEEKKEEIEISEKGIPSWLLKLRNIFLLIIGLLSAWNAYYGSVTNHKLDEQSKILNQRLREAEFKNDLRFKIFDEVKNAISDKDSNYQEVVKVMIEEVLTEDSAFQEKMKAVLLSSRNTSQTIKEDIHNTENFHSEEQELKKTIEEIEAKLTLEESASEKASGSMFANHRIDVFFIGDKNNSSAKYAEEIVTLLKQKCAGADIKIRLLPHSVNAKRDYRISNNQVRYDTGEDKKAQALKDIIDSAHILPAGIDELHKMPMKTSHYLSIYVYK